MREIRTAMDELSAGSSQITSALSEIINSSETVRVSTDTIDKRVKALDSSLDSVLSLSAENQNGMDEIKTGVGEVFKAVQIVNDGSAANADNMRAIDERIGRFKTSKKED